MKKAKLAAKLVHQYAHGKNGTESAVSKRDRMFEEGDILDIFNFFRIKSDTFEGNSEICEFAALTILSEFDSVDPH